jgi:serine O-acetyltransferase
VRHTHVEPRLESYDCPANEMAISSSSSSSALRSRGSTSMPRRTPEVVVSDEADRESAQVATASAEVADWSREDCSWWAWDPSRQLICAMRDYQKARSRGGRALLWAKVAVLRHRFWSVIAGADVPINAEFGGGLVLPHPNGIVVHPGAEIGPNCMIFQQVTIGTGPKAGLPRIGGHVDVGPGAKILGGVHVGDHAVIGANAVVLSDVPAGGVAVGVPAKITRVVDYHEP